MTQSPSGSLRARQEPRIWIHPDFELTDAERCADLCAAAGIELFPWELNVLGPWLAHDSAGRWVCGTNGLAMPRQNGKTGGCFRPRAAWGMLTLGERVLYTAHLQKTSTETFEDFAALFDSKALSKYVKKINTAMGREGIYLKNGGRIKFLARTNGGGRGQTKTDLLAYDEAQELTDEQQASFNPTQKSSRNPQTVYLGTPDMPGSGGGTFRRLRRNAIDGKAQDGSWAEWGVATWPKDIHDKTIWYDTNPSLIHLFPERNLEKDANELAEDMFVREDLGYWSPDTETVDSALSLREWAACEVEEAPEPVEGEKVCCAVKFSPDGTIYSVSTAVRYPKESRQDPEPPVLVELVTREGTNRGISDLADWLNERRDRFALVAIDGHEWSSTLAQKLIDNGYPKRGLAIIAPREMAEACAMLSGAVIERRIQHIEQEALAESIASSPRRPIGRDGWGFGGIDPTPIESCALAYRAVMKTKRNPNRKARVSV